MKLSIKLILICLYLLLISCSGKEEKTIELNTKDIEDQMIEAYQNGLNALEEGDVLFAAKNFNIVEKIYPQSIWASKSILMAAYAYYSQDYYNDAISELQRFLKNHPQHPYYPYAYFLLATCYYELIVDEKKDLSSLENSKKYYRILIKDYPNTDFALDAKYKLDLIDNILASKEIYIGKFYLTKSKWIPAMNRFKNVVDNYSNTEYVEEALHRLVEINYKLGLTDEARNYASLLGYNYQSSRWYEESYKIFNKDYTKTETKEISKNRSFIIRKFKDLFE